MECVAGIDLGTSSIKVLITDVKGRTVALAHKEYEVITRKLLYAEQLPDVWWSAAKEAIQEAVLRANIRPDDLKCIGFSGQMHGLVALDKENKPVIPAIIWMDQRSDLEAKMIGKLAGDLIDGELLNKPNAGMMISSLLWLKRNKAAEYEKIEKVLLPKDYIRFKLTGMLGTDCTDACATLAYSVKNCEWCMELIRKTGLKEEIWPEVHKSYEIAGYVTQQAAEETGLSRQTAVVFGAGDSAAQLTGNGVIEKGVISCNIGTASQIATTMEKPFHDKEKRLQTWCHAASERWYIQGGTLNGGSTLSWLKKKVLHEERSYSEMDKQAAEVVAGSEGLIFLPYLAGERTPVCDTKAKGIYFGLSMKHDQSYMIRATQEGVVYNLKDCLSILKNMNLPCEKLISSGGAAKGNTWKQIQADILEMPVYTTSVEEEACLGAAILATVGMGYYTDVKEACSQIVKVNQNPIEPIRKNVEIYRQRQEIFNKLYRNTKELFQQL